MSSRLRVATRTSSPVAMDLDPDAVELDVHGDRSPPAPPWPSPRPGRGRWRRASAAPAGRPPARPSPAPPRRPRTPCATIGTVPPASIAARRTAGSGTSAADATASWTRASSAPWRTAAGEGPAQPHLLGGGGAAEERRRPRPVRVACEPVPRQRRDQVERLVHLGDGEARLVRGLDAGAGAAPPDAGATLPQRPAEVCRHRLELLGGGPAQARGQRGDLGLARAGGRDGGGRLDDLVEEHPPILSGAGDNGLRLVSDDLLYVPRFNAVPATRRCGFVADVGDGAARHRGSGRTARRDPAAGALARGHAGRSLRPGQPALAPHRRRSARRWPWSPARTPTSARRSTPPRPSTAGSSRPGTTRPSTCAAPVRIVDDPDWLRGPRRRARPTTTRRAGRRRGRWRTRRRPTSRAAARDRGRGAGRRVGAGKAKLSQNRSAEDRAGVVAGLSGRRASRSPGAMEALGLRPRCVSAPRTARGRT